jgi:DUF971 family protein
MTDALTEVRNDKDRRMLALSWQSGLQRAVPYAMLRGYCPCAHCQGHGAGPKKFVDSAADLALIGIKAVGHYALQLVWSDGHQTGIYTFDYLRDVPLERAS